jgi:tRNA(Leu) C34 or U34 (ribose-2'-O)-methylase TrmL
MVFDTVIVLYEPEIPANSGTQMAADIALIERFERIKA